MNKLLPWLIIGGGVAFVLFYEMTHMQLIPQLGQPPRRRTP